MRELVIVGAGPHGRETVDIVEAINASRATWSLLGFVDDGQLVSHRGERPRAELVGPVGSLRALVADYVIGIGDPMVRAALDQELTAWGRRAATLIHPLASVGGDNRFEAGVVLAAGARVTTNVTIERHVHLNVNAVVSHDCVVGAHTTLAPGAHVNGDVTIGPRSYVGAGAIVLPGVSIGHDAMIGAGAVVVHDVAPGTTVKGVPAK